LASGTKKINPQGRPGHEGSFRQTGPLDRLTRSLADFAKLVELFDAQGVSFVSVIQQFNTTTSMGRLTLNVLLSFAQFEREVTSERIRDKIAASKDTVRRLLATDESFDALCHQYRHVIDLLEGYETEVGHEAAIEQLKQRQARLEEELLTRIEGYQPQ